MANRAVIAQAVRAHQPRSTGGTTAPRSAAQGPKIGVSPARPAQVRAGLGQGRPVVPPKSPGTPPGAPPPSPYTPTPWDSAYEKSVSAARAKYNNANIGLDYQEQAAKQAYGLDAGFNDYKSNPYSRAALLEQSFQQANRGSLNSYAAQGQLYAGSLSNALSANRSSYGQSRDALEKAYRDALQEIQQNRLAASDEMAGGITDAEWAKALGASEAPLDASTAPAPPGRPKPKRPKQARAWIAQNKALGGRRK